MDKHGKLRKGRVIAAASIAAALLVLVIVLIHSCSTVKKADTDNVLEAAVITSEETTQTTAAATTTAQVTTFAHIDSPTCKAAALYCVDSGELLYSDRINERIAPASMTKLLTAAAAFGNMKSDEMITAGSELSFVQPYSSLCGLLPGSTSSLKDYAEGLLLSSGNDAAYTIAVSVARKMKPDVQLTNEEAVRDFCTLMNELAAKIGMKSSHFANPDGWDNDEQYTTVADLLVLTEYVRGIPQICEICGSFRKSVTFATGEVFEWTNSNLLLDPYSEYHSEYAVGMKTGSTEKAGKCLISVFCEKGKMYIAVVAGCASDNDRYELTLKLEDMIQKAEP